MAGCGASAEAGGGAGAGAIDIRDGSALAPLLFEAGMHDVFDATVAVVAEDAQVGVDVRGRREIFTVTKPPFVTPGVRES